MIARITTVAFQRIDVIPIDVQIQMISAMPAFVVVGLPDKAVAESRERVRSALEGLGLALPPQRIVINLSPADLQKEGSHYDVPIALSLLMAMGILPRDELAGFTALGELALDGSLVAVSGVLPAALDAAGRGQGIICPQACGGEAAWAPDIDILAAPHILNIINHFKGSQVLTRPEPQLADTPKQRPDLADIKGQEMAKRALEIAAAGGHNMLMVGPPGAGKSMLAARLPGLLPPLSPMEAMEVTMIHSLAGRLEEGKLLHDRPFRDPHHSASLPALVGGGLRAHPGEISLAHRGVLFLDELPEFAPNTLESLRQPLETGCITIARANNHVMYPAQVQLMAAMNPCRCGYVAEPERACLRAPRCALQYQARLSGPLLDRIDIQIDMPAIALDALLQKQTTETSAIVAERVLRARALQEQRYADYKGERPIRCNAEVNGTHLNEITALDAEGQTLLIEAARKLKLSARGYHRVLKLARTIADMEESAAVRYPHVAEALSYRRGSVSG
jgi:magnesium chelatase family protein